MQAWQDRGSNCSVWHSDSDASSLPAVCFHHVPPVLVPVRHDVVLPKDEIDAVADLRCAWQKLVTKAEKVGDTLAVTQVGLRVSMHDGRAALGLVVTWRTARMEHVL